MTVTAGASRSDYLGDGVQTEFPVGFQALAETDLAVYLSNPADLSSPTKLALNTHYTVIGSWAAGTAAINLVTPPASGIQVAILRDITISQATNYEQYDDFPADSHERALDKLTMICQALDEKLERTVQYPVGATEEDILDSSAFLGTCSTARNEALEAQEAAETARVVSEMARDAAITANEHAQTAASTASAGATVITNNQEGIDNITANLVAIQDAPTAALTATSAALTATTKAGEANASALAAAQSASEAAAAASGGALMVSADDTALGYLETKLLAGDGLAASTQNAGGAETRSLSVALAASSGLEFADELLRVKAGAGLAVSSSGLAADVGTTAGKLVQLDSEGALPAVSGANLTGLSALAKLGLIANRLVYIGAAGVPQQLALGAAGTVLKSQGATLAPVFGTTGGDGWGYVSSATASGSSYLAFTGLNFTAFDYRLEVNTLDIAASQAMYLVFGTGATPTYLTTGYGGSVIIVLDPLQYYANPASGLVVASGAGSATRMRGFIEISQDSGKQPSASVLLTNSSGRHVIGGGENSTTTAVTALKLFSAGTISSGVVKLYRKTKR